MTERVTLEPVKRIKVTKGALVVAETEHGYVVHEAGLSDRFYVPRADVRAELADGTGTGVCPWKGDWRHLDVTVDGETVANGAWTYHRTEPVTVPVRDFIAFYDTKFSVEHS